MGEVEALWDLFDGDAERLNLAHECVDRWGGRGTALRLKCADGRTEAWSFQDLAAWSSRFANLLETDSIAKGDRVAVMLDPSLAFYGAVFGAVKRGAVAVPLFTLLGPDGVRLRVDDCQPRLLLVTRDAERWQEMFPRVRVLAVDDRLQRRLAAESPRYAPATRADDLAILQYTSGTTRGLPEAVRHTHRAVVTLMVAALYGLGLNRATTTSARPRRPGVTGSGTARSRRSLSASPSAPTRGSSTPGVCSKRSRSSASPTSPPRRRSSACCAPRGLRRGRGSGWRSSRSRASRWTRARGSGSRRPSASRRVACTARPRSA